MRTPGARLAHRVGAVMGIALAGAALTACVDDQMMPPDVSVDAVKYVNGAKLVVIDGQEWLAVGGPPIPPGMPIPAPPEPYNPRKHGPLLKNTMPDANLVFQAHFQPPPKAEHHLPKESRADPESMQAERGRGFWRITGGPTIGMYSYPEVTSDFPISSFYPNAYIYTSTELPYGYSCIEMTILHSQVQTHRHGFYNQCATPGHWLSLENMANSAWMDRYARIMFDPELHIFHEIHQHPRGEGGTGCWRGILFNWTDMQWEEKTPLICGTGAYEFGWTGWESWNFMELMDSSADCPNLLSVSNYVSSLYNEPPNQIPFQHLSGSPERYGVCFREGYYNLRALSNPSEWAIDTPLPDQIP